MSDEDVGGGEAICPRVSAWYGEGLRDSEAAERIAVRAAEPLEDTSEPCIVSSGRLQMVRTLVGIARDAVRSRALRAEAEERARVEKEEREARQKVLAELRARLVEQLVAAEAESAWGSEWSSREQRKERMGKRCGRREEGRLLLSQLWTTPSVALLSPTMDSYPQGGPGAMQV